MISLPLTPVQEAHIVLAAEAFGVEPWEMMLHVLAFKQKVQAAQSDGDVR